MGRKKSKKNMYFDESVQDAIVEYNTSTDDAFRSRLYGEKIHYAFDKLSENIINTFKFTYFDDGFEDVKAEVVSFLVMNMHKYDHTKGSKAFSYFSIVAKNYLILHNNNNYKKLKLHTTVDTLNYHPTKDGDNEMKDFTLELITYFDKNIKSMFKKKRDIDIAYAIIELMKRIDEIENFNKKGLYILIREMTGVNTSHITKIVNIMKTHYRKLNNQYYSNGTIRSESSSSNKFF